MNTPLSIDTRKLKPSYILRKKQTFMNDIKTRAHYMILSVSLYSLVISRIDTGIKIGISKISKKFQISSK